MGARGRGRTDGAARARAPGAFPKSPDAEAATQVIVVIGSNGMGKTTTIGKLAARLRADGRHVLLAACDTYRAAAVEQLDEWAKRAGVDIVVPDANVASPAAVRPRHSAALCAWAFALCARAAFPSTRPRR